MALNGMGEVGVMAAALNVEVEERPWFITIRRVDGGADPAFAALHGHAVTADNIKAILPHWNALDWTHHPSPFPNLRRESRATDGAYRVYLSYADGGNPAAAEVVAQFVADLA